MTSTLPNLGLTGAFTDGQDDWGDLINANLLKLSSTIQISVSSTVSIKPVSPVEGLYLMADDEPTNPNTLGVFQSGIWTHYAPKAGWVLYDRAAQTFKYYTGTAWTNLPITTDNIMALGALNTAVGVIEQTGPSTFEKRNVGTTADTDILSRAAGDTRYSVLSHTHPEQIGFTLEAEAPDEVVYRHAFTRPFEFSGNFDGFVGRAESASSDYILTVMLQSAAGEAFSTRGTLTVASTGAVTAATVSGAAFTAPAGSVMKIVAPSSGPTLVGLTITFAPA